MLKVAESPKNRPAQTPSTAARSAGAFFLCIHSRSATTIAVMATTATSEIARRGVVDAGVGVADEHEQRQSDHDHERAEDLTARHVLGREPVPERQRPDDRRDEQRLHDDELAPVERRALRPVADQQDHGAEQPGGHREQPDQPAHALDRVAPARERELPALLQRGRKGEAHRRDESEERCHGSTVRTGSNADLMPNG